MRSVGVVEDALRLAADSFSRFVITILMVVRFDVALCPLLNYPRLCISPIGEVHNLKAFRLREPVYWTHCSVRWPFFATSVVPWTSPFCNIRRCRPEIVKIGRAH